MKQELQDMIIACSAELADIGNKMGTLPALDKTKSYLTQYALIRACGTIEFVFRSIVADFFDQFGVDQIDTYIDKTVRRGSMSCTYDNMRSLLGKFDDSWCNNFKQVVNQHADGQRMISSVNSLVTNRHLFAHGRPPTATFTDICQYYQDGLTLIGLFDSVVV